MTENTLTTAVSQADSSTITELGRFLAIAKERLDSGKSTEMFSGNVDLAWHDLLNNEEAYEDFSERYAGQVIPHSPGNGHGEISWIRDYEKRFGALPEAWFKDSKGNLDRFGKQFYEQTGRVIASWDCTVTGT